MQASNKVRLNSVCTLLYLALECDQLSQQKKICSQKKKLSLEQK